MKKAHEYLRELYLDYFNNYLTIDTFAQDHGIHPTDARRLLSLGKALHNNW